MAIEDVETHLQELIRHPGAAELASRRRLRVREVSSREGHVWRHIFLARQTGRWVDRNKLDGCTVDLLLSDSLAEESFNEVCEGREAIHPLPPAQLTEWLQDTIAEEGERRRQLQSPGRC